MARKRSPKTWKKKCDALWGEIIRSVGHCEVCGKSECQLHAHHLIHRSAIFFRHNLNNGVCLCPYCHEFSVKLSAHGAPWAFEAWMKKHKPSQYKWWAKNRYEVITGVKIDYEQVYSVLAAGESK